MPKSMIMMRKLIILINLRQKPMQNTAIVIHFIKIKLGGGGRGTMKNLIKLLKKQKLIRRSKISELGELTINLS